MHWTNIALVMGLVVILHAVEYLSIRCLGPRLSPKWMSWLSRAWFFLVVFALLLFVPGRAWAEGPIWQSIAEIVVGFLAGSALAPFVLGAIKRLTGTAPAGEKCAH